MVEAMPPNRLGAFHRGKFFTGLARTLIFQGNYPRGVKMMRWAIDDVPDQLRGGRSRYQALLGLFQAYAGDFDTAETNVDRASSNLVQSYKHLSGTSINVAWIHYMEAEARAAIAATKGRLAKAEALYREAFEIFEKTIPWTEHHGYARLAYARVLARQGRLMEAENEVRELIARRQWIRRDSLLMPMVMTSFAEVLFEQGRFADAEKSARIANKMYRAICSAPENPHFAGARNILAKSLIAQEHWREAATLYDTIEKDMAKDRASFERLFTGNPFRALAMLRTGRSEAALADLRRALEKTRDRLGAKHYRTAEIKGFLAMVQLFAGDREGALGGFREAIDILLRRSRESDDESSTFKARDRRLTMILDAYIGLLADIRGTPLAAGFDPVDEAFRLADVPRLRSVQRALSASGARSSVCDPALADLARREQDAQKRIAVLYGSLAKELSRPAPEQSASREKELRVAIDTLRGARAALMEEIEKTHPQYAQLINPKPLDIAGARAALHPGEALLATFVGETRTFVWAVPQAGPVAFAAVDLGAKDLTARVTHLRKALEPQASTLGDIPDFDLAAAHDLYKRLLAPVADGWRGADSLLVVARGPLGHLPLSLLPTRTKPVPDEREPLFSRYRDVAWLARSHAITLLPAVASLKTLRGLPPGGANRRAFAGFGDPLFGPGQTAAAPNASTEVAQRGLAVRGLPIHLRSAPHTQNVDSAELALLPRLPETADEVRAMAVAMRADPSSSVFTGVAASEERIKSMDLADVRVLAFATHGLVPGDLNGLLQPALALSSPEVTGDADNDGLLTMGEVLGLKLDADWVVLSACNTGSGDGAGAEAVSGLGRAFFYAGTRALLVSNWPVETTTARELTTALFRLQGDGSGVARAEALRRARVALIDEVNATDARGRPVFAYAHPIFWAPFTLIGDGGG